MRDLRPLGTTTKPKIHPIFANPLAKPAFDRMRDRILEHSNFVRYFHRKLLNHASPQMKSFIRSILFKQEPSCLTSDSRACRTALKTV
jgi:hypothetical protein